MPKNIHSLLKPARINGKVLSYQDTSEDSVAHYFCSTFIKKKNLLLKGEWRNEHHSNRNALVVLFDADTGKVRGEDLCL